MNETRREERENMVRQIEAEARETAAWTGRAELDPHVLDAMRRVPRHEFVRPGDATVAYVNTALPIACGQTISQPFVVALMSDLARVEPEDVVLEVGTGCGYQTAVLCELAHHVYSVEIVPELAEAATKRLSRLDYVNFTVRAGDGHNGWPEHAPYDAIVVTAATPEVPPALYEQLAVGGRLVIPVGEAPHVQNLMVIDKDAQGRVQARSVLPVAFVPMTRCA